MNTPDSPWATACLLCQAFQSRLFLPVDDERVLGLLDRPEHDALVHDQRFARRCLAASRRQAATVGAGDVPVDDVLEIGFASMSS